MTTFNALLLWLDILGFFVLWLMQYTYAKEQE